MSESAAADDRDAVSTDRVLSGRLVLRQPRTGHRAGTDAVLLAAAAAATATDRFIDVGAGVGTVGLAVALQQPACHGVLLEVDPATADLARVNVAANGMADRLQVVVADLFDAEACRTADLLLPATLVVTNPPFLRAGGIRASPDPRRAIAHVLGQPGILPHQGDCLLSHGDWVRRCVHLLQPRGRLLLIHRSDAMPEILAAMPQRVGGLILRLIHPHADQPAVRVLVGGTVGSKTPAIVLPPLVLHETDGRFTAEAEALHEGEPMTFWPQKSRPRRAGP